ncbi:helix-turn-helix domain-containing protein [uncultured Candidatus Kuenenia sp.]|uniref:helix-turn-helix domain-containing protein n=1 Tax=uncultured Candidatus Kuenenia sp. TaxID=1048336 RepID=UPI002084728D|nr:helix-turn-helix domain-containing protein [uncultured Candidatus Kuenenia sp.]GJQ48606.1 MAG: hypothetical protein HKUEN01_09920 [Candidatus Kuenenia stuttgartiensis]
MPKNSALNPLPKKNFKIDIGRALELRFKNGMSYGEIARHFGVSKSYVHGILQRFTNLIREPEELEFYEKYKTKLLSSAELKILEKLMDDETIKGATLNNAAYAFQNLFNANRLERGKSTANIDIHHTQEEVEALDAEYEELKGLLENR